MGLLLEERWVNDRSYHATNDAPHQGPGVLAAMGHLDIALRIMLEDISGLMGWAVIFEEPATLGGSKT
jgi:hypothetical protein